MNEHTGTTTKSISIYRRDIHLHERTARLLPLTILVVLHDVHRVEYAAVRVHGLVFDDVVVREDH